MVAFGSLSVLDSTRFVSFEFLAHVRLGLHFAAIQKVVGKLHMAAKTSLVEQYLIYAIMRNGQVKSSDAFEWH